MLVRPDGHVAWRSRSLTTDPAATLRQAMTRVLGRTSGRALDPAAIDQGPEASPGV